MRCLVRDPRRLGPERVRVQIALGDLADPPSFRNAMRGVSTVVHLAAAIRDQPAALDRGAQRHRDLAHGRGGRARRRRALRLLLALGATAHDRTRFLRAKALAEDGGRRRPADDDRRRARSSTRRATPGSRCSALSLLPAIAERRRAACSRSGRRTWPTASSRARRAPDGRRRHELAGPETLSHESIVRLVLEAGAAGGAVDQGAGAGARRAQAGEALPARARR